MKFNCEPCNYETDIKFCFDKHKKTVKHTEKVSTYQMSASSTHESINLVSFRSYHHVIMEFNKIFQKMIINVNIAKI